MEETNAAPIDKGNTLHHFLSQSEHFQGSIGNYKGVMLCNRPNEQIKSQEVV